MTQLYDIPMFNYSHLLYDAQSGSAIHDSHDSHETVCMLTLFDGEEAICRSMHTDHFRPQSCRA